MTFKKHFIPKRGVYICIISVPPIGWSQDKIRHPRDLLVRPHLRKKKKERKDPKGMGEALNYYKNLNFVRKWRKESWTGSLRLRNTLKKILGKPTRESSNQTTCQHSSTSHRNGLALVFLPCSVFIWEHLTGRMT